MGVCDMEFGQPHQNTMWVSAFLPMLLKLAETPRSGMIQPHNKLHFFLNHRELLYASAKILGLPVRFESMPPEKLPSAASIIVEVYDNNVKIFFWEPSHAGFTFKAKFAQEGWPVEDLFHNGGHLTPTAPQGCTPGELCPITT